MAFYSEQQLYQIHTKKQAIDKKVYVRRDGEVFVGYNGRLVKYASFVELNKKADDSEISLVGRTNDYNDLDNKPIITPGVDKHSELTLDDGTNPHGTTKSDVGLGDVPNLDTTNAVANEHTHNNKTILDLITEAFTSALKTTYDNAVTWISTNGTNLINHLTDTNNPHNVMATQIGLGNVDNTSDLDKPISTATQTALNSKHDNPTGTPDGTKYLRDDNTWQPVVSNSPRILVSSSTLVTASAASNVKVYSKLIPANTVTANSILTFEATLQNVSGTSQTKRIRPCFNTTDDLSGVTYLVSHVFPATNQYGKIYRTWGIPNNSSLKGFQFANTNAPSDFGSSNSAMDTLSIDWTIDQYFIIAMLHSGTTDENGVAYFSLKIDYPV